MNKNTLIWGIVVLVVIALGFWYFSSSSVGGAPATEPTATTTQESSGGTGSGTSGGTTTTSTFRSIFTQEGNNQCSYELVESSSRSSSVIYIADGKMRGEFRTVSGGAPVASLMIYDGGFLYSWEEGKTTGRKTALRSIADLPQAIPADLSSGAVLGESLENVSWDCHSWAKDASAFVIPTYVTFTAAS